MPWPTKKLGEVCEFVFGYSFNADDFNEQGKGLPVIRIGDIDKGITEKFYDKEYDDKYLVEKGEILIGLSGSIKIDKWKGKKALLNQRIVKVCNFKHEILEDFVFYQLHSILKRLEIQIAQGTVKNLLLPHLSNLKILVPPLKTQQKIVERLDAIKKAQELNDKQIELAEELFKSLLHCELDPKGKNWEVKKLIEVCEINPKTVLNKKIDKVRYVEMTAIDENLKTIKYYLDRSINKVSSGAPKFTNNDIIFARITPCTENGKIALVDNCKDICAGSTELHVLRPKKDKILPHFLFYFIITPKIRNIAVASMIGSTGRQRVPAEFFHYLKIPLPPLETQQKIVEKLSAVQEYKKKLLDQKQKLQELFESVLNKSFKGEWVG